MTLISGMTEAGLELLAKSQTGKKIYFTRMKVGTGRISEDINFAELTDLITPIAEIDIQASEIIKQKDKTVALKVSSVAIQKDEDYYFREIGLFAVDPDTEDEILYAYINKGEEATYIPKSSNDIAIQELATMVVAIGNENNIIVNCESDLKIIEQIEGNGGYSLFDTVIKDHLLSFEESEGFALQGTYVYKEGIAGERWGYPDFIAQCIQEKNEAEPQRMALGNSTIMSYVHSNGHIYYDISDKNVVDNFFNTMGVAWFYGIDETNERVFLPRNNYFFKSSSSNPGQYNAPQLPSLAHSHTLTLNTSGSHNHSVTIGSNGAHTHTRGTMNITGQISGLSYDQSDSRNGMKGAFSWLSASKKGAASGESDRYASFNAANSWTGSTSSNGNHDHTATVGSSGSHTHEATLANSNPAGTFSGSTVLPPSVNGLLYIVVGNVRQKSAIVINAELQNAIAMLQSRQSLAESAIDETKVNAIEDINIVKESAIVDVENAGTEQLSLINSDINTASEYASEAQRQAEIAEQYANLAIAGQLQTDWNQSDQNAVDFIKNKPQCDWENITYKENVQTLKNKSISGSENIISDLTFNSFANELILNSINSNNATNDTFATSRAVLNAIYDLPIASKNIVNNLTNLNNISDQAIPTTLAVYNSLNDIQNSININLSGEGVIDVDTILSTDVILTTSNTDLTVSSSYNDTEQSIGTKTFNFTFRDNEWVNDNNESVNLSDYKISIEGNPNDEDTITLQYITTSTNFISANVSEVAVSGSYNDLEQKPIFGNGLVETNSLVTTTIAEVSNKNLTISCSYSGTKNEIGIIEYNFTYENGNWLDDNENIIDLTNYDLSITGTPEDGDIISLTYKTFNQLTVSTNKPIPTKLSELTDNLGTNPVHTHSQYLTEHQDISGKADSSDLSEVAFSGDYDDLLNKPAIPTVPTTLSSFTDNLGTNPVHTHSQYQTKSNLVTSLSASNTDSQYASARCVFNLIDGLTNTINSLDTGSSSSVPVVTDPMSLFQQDDPNYQYYYDDYMYQNIVPLKDNYIYCLQSNNYITFNLPSIDDSTIFHQILIQLYVSNNDTSIDFGTLYFFNKSTPEVSTSGYYNIIYEYDSNIGQWVCGVISKGDPSASGIL